MPVTEPFDAVLFTSAGAAATSKPASLIFCRARSSLRPETSGTGTGGVMFYAEVPTAQKNTVKNALKSILNNLALSK